MLMWFLLRPAPRLLQRQARQRTAQAALIADILSLLAGRRSAPPPARPRPPLEPLSNSELRVLRYLPTNLTGLEISRWALADSVSIGTLAGQRHRGRARHPGR